MMPLVLYLLYSDDLKKQSDNVIQQLKGAGNAIDFANDFLSIFSGIAELKAENEQLRKDQLANTLDIKAAIEELKTQSIQFQQNQIISLQEIKDAVNEIKNHSDPKIFADNLFTTMKEMNGQGMEKAQEFFDKQIKAANDISASVSELHNKISVVDRLTEKIAELERVVLSQRKLK